MIAEFLEKVGRFILREFRTLRSAITIPNAVGVVVGFLFIAIASALFGDGWMGWLLLLYPKTYIDTEFGPVLNLWFQFAGIFVFGVVAVHLVEFCRRQVKAFCSWAGEIDIDLLDIERYQVFTIQPLRYLLITVIFISANVIVFRILSFTNPTFGLLAVQLPLMIAMLAFAYYVAKPIIILRNKIKQAKANEIDVIRRALAGDRNKL